MPGSSCIRQSGAKCQVQNAIAVARFWTVGCVSVCFKNQQFILSLIFLGFWSKFTILRSWSMSLVVSLMRKVGPTSYWLPLWKMFLPRLKLLDQESFDICYVTFSPFVLFLLIGRAEQRDPQVLRNMLSGLKCPVPVPLSPKSGAHY